MTEDEARIARCDCGKVTTFICHELWPHEGLVPCSAPLCSAECKAHRHEPGTMGYARFTSGRAEYLGDSPNGPGIWERLCSLGRTLFWSDQHKAQHIWDRMLQTRIRPPAPLPPFVLSFGGGHKHFQAFGKEMRELGREPALFEEGK